MEAAEGTAVGDGSEPVVRNPEEELATAGETELQATAESETAPEAESETALETEIEVMAEAPPEGGFVHPGILHTAASLEHMRAQIEGQVQPAYGSYLRLRDESEASPSYDLNGPYATMGHGPNDDENHKNAVTEDFNAAYYNALMWHFTGNVAHADKAEEILVGYANRVSSITSRNQPLFAGLQAFIYVNAAELMRSYLSAEDVDAVKTMIVDLLVPITHTFYDTDPYSNGNWGAALNKGAMAYAIFTDDRELYDFALDWYLNGTDNGVLRHYVDDADGQNQESGRDQQHSMLGIGCLAEAAEVAYNQGDDLYGGYDGDNRLMQGFEYVSQYNLGNDVPYYVWDDLTGKYDDWSSISADGRGEFRNIFEMPYNHYVRRLGLSMPWTERVLEDIRPEGPGALSDHPGFGSLLFSYAGD